MAEAKADAGGDWAPRAVRDHARQVDGARRRCRTAETAALPAVMKAGSFTTAC